MGNSRREEVTAFASSSHRVAFALSSLSQTVFERLPCNYLCVSSVTLMSATVYCFYTLLIMYPYYMLSHSIVWHLIHVMYNIINTQRNATSVAGQICSYSDKATKGGSQYLCLNENVSLLRHRQFYRADIASLV